MNKTKIIQYQVSFWQWYRLRKKTVLAHWIYGLLCAYIGMKYFPASLAMMGLFGGFERWDDKCSGTKEGAMDFWDGLLTYSIGFGIVLVLEGISLVTIRWI